MTWFIDSWAVQDGFVFASERESESTEVVQTIFAAPPYFDPIPILNISTALAASRGHFQERLLDLDGNEISFENLEEIIELVRRSYLKGGSGLLPPDGSGTEGEPPLDQNTDGIERPFSPEEIDQEGSRQEITNLIEDLATEKDRKNLANSFNSRLNSNIDQKLLYEFAKDVALELLKRLNFYHIKQTSTQEILKLLETSITWLEMSYRINSDFRIDNIIESGDSSIRQICDTYDLRAWWESRDLRTSFSKIIISGYLFRVPLPQRWCDDSEYRSIGDLLHSVAADRIILNRQIANWTVSDVLTPLRRRQVRQVDLFQRCKEVEF